MSACLTDTAMDTTPQLITNTGRSTRSSRSSVKRALSVDNLAELDIMSQSTSKENLSTGNTKCDFVVVNSKRRRKQKYQTKLSQSHHHQLPQSGSRFDNTEVQTADEGCQAESTIITDDLVAEVTSLKATVKTLQNQLDFILSFLGITNSTQLLNTASTSHQVPSTVMSRDPAPCTDTTYITDTFNSVSNGLSDSVSNAQTAQATQSYANMVRKPAALSVPLRNAVVSAVYADFEEKNRRARNIVISGLSTSSVSDKVAVENLCDTEIGFKPQIVSCRRLGQQISGRVQPVLVVLQSVSDAEYLIRNARCLRQSTNPVIRSDVYINADLTKAEALTAYQRRCRRRQMAAARNNTNTNNQPITVLNTRVQSVDHSAGQSTTERSATVSAAETPQSPITETSTVDDGHDDTGYTEVLPSDTNIIA